MKNFTDNQLIASLDNVVRRERELLAEVLNHFKEFDRRKLFSKLGYSSLHEYAVKHLKYSDDQAYRRVQAMRLMRDMPEIETKIENGSLTLSSLSQAQSYFRKTESTKEEKKEILAKLENATKREAQKIFRQDDIVRYSFEADQEFESMIEEIRGLHPHLNFDQLMRKVWELAYDKLKPTFTRPARAAMKPRNNPTSNKAIDKKSSRSRYIPNSVKREVWQNAQGKCQRCKSDFALEFDHILPFAKGGSNEKDNLRLLCRSCNQRSAIEHYGPSKIEMYLLREPILTR